MFMSVCFALVEEHIMLEIISVRAAVCVCMIVRRCARSGDKRVFRDRSFFVRVLCGMCSNGSQLMIPHG